MLFYVYIAEHQSIMAAFRGKFKQRVILVIGIILLIIVYLQINLLKHHADSKLSDYFPVFSKSSKSRMFQELDVYDANELKDYIVPNTVHYVWCHKHTIRYEHYLSILSAWKFLRPDIIEFHHLHNISDTDIYNMWLRELKQQIPGLLVEKLPEHWDYEEYGCGVHFGIAVLHDRGGIYIGENVTFVKSVRDLRQNNFTIGLSTRADAISFLMSIEKDKRLRKLANLKHNGELSFDSFNGTIVCDVINGGRRMSSNEDSQCIELSEIHPADIMHLNTTVGAIARKLTYGSSDVVKTRQLLPGKIPKYVHLVWYHRKEMTFMMYLSVRSALVILNPEKVFIHGDKELKGDYFDKIKRDPRVVQIYREIPKHIYGHSVLFTQHRSDIIRADVLLKYGGIYMDWDVLWLKPIDALIETRYDAIVNFDHSSRQEYPDSMNLGVFLAKKNSHFVRYWQDSLRNYKTHDFYHNALELPYKTYEKYPHTVHVEKHLQVMCFRLKCHPIWNSQYKNFEKDQRFDWRKDAYAVHFTHPDPPEYANETALRRGYGKFADMGKFIMKSKYKYDEN